jgi:ATP-binding cassette, subfamily B, bacterial MsbA
LNPWHWIRTKLFRSFDPRLAAELRSQRKLIAIGLACVVVTSILTSSTAIFIKYSLQAINDARNLSEQHLLQQDEIRSLSARLGRTDVEVSRALAGIESRQVASGTYLSPAEEAEVARSLRVDPASLHREMQSTLAERGGDRRTPQDALRMLAWLSLGVVGIYGLKYWFTRGQVYFLSKAANSLATDLRIKLFDKLQRLPVTYFNEKRAGGIQSVLTNDVNVYQSAVGMIRDSIDGPIKAIGSLIVIFVLQWQLALVAVCFFPFMFAAIQRNSKKMKAAQAKVQEDLADLASVSLESLQGSRVVKAFSAEERVLQDYRGYVSRSFRSQMEAVKRLASLRPLVELIGAVGLALVIYVAGVLASQGRLQVADIGALVFALDVVNQGFRHLGSVKNTGAQVEAASSRIYKEILDVPEEHIDSPDSITLPLPLGRIEFKNVSFTYPDGTPALKNVSFTIEPGRSLALVGPSGAGKSTIADLVLRFYDPTEGDIFFDGVNLKEIKVSWLRGQIGVVPQQTFLFSGSIADNIRLGKPGATEEEIAEAAHAAHADVFVEKMPSRYASTIGEQGMGLSGGEKQRVAIARALVRKPSLLLLDEATSALDATSEKEVTKALEEIMHQRTTLFIAHRLTTAARADEILYLRRGEVVEQGSHRELMDRNGEYAALFRVFSNGVLDESLT